MDQCQEQKLPFKDYGTSFDGRLQRPCLRLASLEIWEFLSRRNRHFGKAIPAPDQLERLLLVPVLPAEGRSEKAPWVQWVASIKLCAATGIAGILAVYQKGHKAGSSLWVFLWETPRMEVECLGTTYLLNKTEHQVACRSLALFVSKVRLPYAFCGL